MSNKKKHSERGTRIEEKAKDRIGRKKRRGEREREQGNRQRQSEWMERWKGREGGKRDNFNQQNLLPQRNFIMLSVPSVHTTEKRNITISNWVILKNTLCCFLNKFYLGCRFFIRTRCNISLILLMATR